MKRKLEIFEIAGYLPYVLKGYFFKNIDLVTGIDVEHKIISSLNNGNVEMKNFKPILRPLSDLYCTLTHNGKETVPIVECAKTVHNFEWELHGKWVILDKECIRFTYDEYRKCFRVYYREEDRPVQNQYQLFDYLHELKIDYRGLIDAGLAIDCNTLNDNPYK
jgi:hypothetical protein